MSSNMGVSGRCKYMFSRIRLDANIYQHVKGACCVGGCLLLLLVHQVVQKRDVSGISNPLPNHKSTLTDGGRTATQSKPLSGLDSTGIWILLKKVGSYLRKLEHLTVQKMSS